MQEKITQKIKDSHCCKTFTIHDAWFLTDLFFQIGVGKHPIHYQPLLSLPRLSSRSAVYHRLACWYLQRRFFATCWQTWLRLGATLICHVAHVNQTVGTHRPRDPSFFKTFLFSYQLYGDDTVWRNDWQFSLPTQIKAISTEKHGTSTMVELLWDHIKTLLGWS